MSKRRVAVTGLGMITPLGTDTAAQWGRICEAQSGISLIARWDASKFAVRFAGEIKNWDPSPWIEKRDEKKLDPFSHYAIAAAANALADSGLDLDACDRDRAGAIIGSGIGGFTTFEDQYDRLKEKGPDKASPFFIPKLMPNAAAGQMSIRWGLRGPCFAIGVALRTIQYDDADILIAGGTEAAITPSGMAGFIAARALSRRNDAPERASRPFDRDRDGFVMGEGAGVVVLEEWEHAKRRSARIYAELAGYGTTADAFHITAPVETGAGAARSMALALRDGACAADAVDYINAHGTSTDLNDKIETRAIKSAFGAHAGTLAISSTKSMIGHLLGASGGAEAVVTALALHHQVAPPTANLENPDPECDLDYVPLRARSMPIRAALSNSFGFGGHNATLLFKRA